MNVTGDPLIWASDEERVARAQGDLRLGLPILLCGQTERAIVLAAEDVNSKRFEALRNQDSAHLAITNWRAQTLKARAYDGDLARIVLPKEANAAWVRDVIDPANDLDHPMKGPFQSLRGGDAELSHLALRLTKSAQLLPAALLATPTEGQLSELPHLEAAVATRVLNAPLAHHPVVNARLPLSVSEAGRLHIFRPEAGGVEHYAVEIGTPDRSKPVLVRLHSACFTGDILGSLKCDCGPQLAAAMAEMARQGSGVLLYLNQEGRGIGLANKMRAYALQDQGFDTVEANHRLGFEDDERDFRIGADILSRLGFHSARLMTNNPAKVAMLENCNISVTERVPLKVGQNPLNQAYLDVKAKKSGHIL